METATSSPPFTPEDLLGLRDAVRYELVDGNLVRRHLILRLKSYRRMTPPKKLMRK